MKTASKQLAGAVLPRRLKVAIRAHYEANRTGGEPELKFVTALCDRQKINIDVGAMLGVYTYLMQTASAHVHAFEPNPELFSKLRQSFGRRVTVHPYALSDSPGTTELMLPHWQGRQIFGRSSIETDVNREFIRERVQIEKERLDDIAAIDKDNVGFIKIDVEGHEYAVLLGADDVIDRSHPTLLVSLQERLHKGIFEKTVQFLGGKGYEGFFVQHGALREAGDFDPAVHQRPEVLTPVDRVSMGEPAFVKGEYVYRFIFVHPSRRHSVERLKRRLAAKA